MIDPALRQAVRNVGYLATHEGTTSDHTYAYIDFGEKDLFKGLINRPVDIQAQEFRITQTDKKVKFQEELIERVKEHNI